MLTKARKDKADRIKQVIAHLNRKVGKKKSARVAELVQQFYARVAPEDIVSANVENLYGAPTSLLKAAGSRKANTPIIRARNPEASRDGWTTPHTVIEIINDDMPFLVDSVTQGLAQAGYAVQLAVHPIVFVKRNAAGRLNELFPDDRAGDDVTVESWIHVQVEHQPTAKSLREIERRMKSILSDVRAAVEDWKLMLARLHETITTMKLTPPPLDAEEVEEATAFLEWMADNHFTLLGVREYEYSGAKGTEAIRLVKGSGLGILRNPSAHVLQSAGTRSGQIITDEVRHLMSQPTPLFVTKANVRSTVHRAVHMDYIGFKRFDKKGRVVGERRFIGLFTSAAYNQSPMAIPLLRRQVTKAVHNAGLSTSSHDGKALTNVLETFPRDELFQIGEDDLNNISLGVLELQDRPRIKAFARRDAFGRFVSCLVYVPREIHTTEMRVRMGKIVAEGFHGHISANYTHVGETPLARIHFIIGIDDPKGAPLAADELDERLRRAARSWRDDLKDALQEHFGEQTSPELWTQYQTAFAAGYRDAFTATNALSDIARMEELTGDVTLAMQLYRPEDAADSSLRFKVFHAGGPLPLSDCLPVLENMGLKVVDENPHKIKRADGSRVWIHDFGLVSNSGGSVRIEAIREQFQETFARVWAGEIENDGFNRLVVSAGLHWRDVVVLRAYSKYLRQARIAFTPEYMESTLAGNPDIAARIVEYFHLRFDPANDRSSVDAKKRDRSAGRLLARIAGLLDQVANLDEDRILRRFLNLVENTLRTNYYQSGQDGQNKGYVSFKLNSQEIDELPLPRPHVEIFVYSPRVEAVHLRGGRVARGGLRWSDRREDFRTEVLGLMKAQMVKNAVIVPVGSKGGFVTKNLPTSGGRDAVMAEVIECYQTFLRGMLDVTDNRTSKGIVHPDQVVRYDGEDSYLVVAADKGTATFSDIANGVAIDYGFWLGDAFASGGSAGYDHKGMGITAKGAWESVKRHFREFGIDTQTEEFTVVGIGDMAGDVFGNGMLLSQHIRLVGAFNHLHIFVDPDPDAKKSWTERNRLFENPRLRWSDYNQKLISKGGGIFDRSAKSIPISAQMKARFDIRRDSLTPNELMRAMLLANVDLLWNGGIGTYVKATPERDADVGDRANDALRVNGNELHCKVIGEGGNLGMTQRGRIEYALNGGRVNTDAIDNSAGVDCSDHEVNIKILVDSVVANKQLPLKQRNRFLAQMTDEVGELVLRTNYLQTQSMTSAEDAGVAAVEEQGRFMRALERRDRLDREIEFLPNDEDLSDRVAANKGLTRPEFAVVQSYAKMVLYDDLLASDLPQDEYFTDDLIAYFPKQIQRKHLSAITGHSLRREIVATLIANSIVNRVGATFINNVMEETGHAPADIARAYAAARGVFDFRSLWADISSLDNKVDAAVQTRMNQASEALLQDVTMWMLNNLPQPLDVAQTIRTYSAGILQIAENLDSMVGELESASLMAAEESYVVAGVSKALARRVAGLDAMRSACHVVHAANASNKAVATVARAYFSTGAFIGLDWLRSAAEKIDPSSHWERLAVNVIIEDLYGQQRALTLKVMDGGGKLSGADAVQAWATANDGSIERGVGMIAEFRNVGTVDMAQLALANRQVRAMIVG
ncbi:MAG: NAD-glutamate dehydrogenase [Alphaproteobacteria bacterium]|jgi:glutamate dehydrogenase|nr:NAD-glutamate dehydrogenase [Alphaproteobacteria bacterium]MBT4965848.1 NAD-glutamate dehydrogenase [Alphaproteobacteria bacterium]MBT5918735.1 NAD-glutamate dehydrogenase [Alphaproteobacteria bacterium]MBT6386372.1 NAD-glutamate dehydrogenase [Alphaproteobacteria bacterium]